MSEETRAFSTIVALTIAVLVSALPGQSQTIGVAEGSVIALGDTSYKVVHRVVLKTPVIFRKPVVPATGGCKLVRVIKEDDHKGCVPAGRMSAVVIGCSDSKPTPPEPSSVIFSRVPGEDVPNLYVSILAVQLSQKRTEGNLEVAFIACGPRIVIPIAGPDEVKNGNSFNFNRISVSISGKKRGAKISLVAKADQAETYRIAGFNEAVVVVVPFKAIEPLEIKQVSGQAQTGDLNIEGEYALGSYSSQRAFIDRIEREIVPAGHFPVAVIRSDNE